MTTPVELLSHAERLLSGLGDTTSGNSSRLAALLARQALEMHVDERCTALGANCGRASMRSRLVLLRTLDDRAIADRLASLWNQLSASCHQHAYELSPTVGEVRELCAGVAAVATAD